MKGLKARLLSGACAAALGLAPAAGAQTTPAARASPQARPTASAQGQGTGISRSDAGQRAAQTDQDTNAGSTAAVGEVIVTGLRANTVQHTPAAVTAFTDERRNLLGIETGRDIANLTPSVSLQGEYLSIRGIGRFEDPGQGLDPGVAVSVDGVYTSSPAYLNQPDFLTDRIEVLRGPQSVFGRNSIGGTVNVYSKRPTADFHGDFRAGYTSQQFGYVDAAVSGPITDTLRFRGGFSGSDERPGGGGETNVAPGYANPATGNSKLYEAQLDWTPTPDIDIYGRYQNYSGDSRGFYGVAAGYGGPGVNQLGPYNTGIPGPVGDYTTNLYFGLAPNPQFGIDPNSNPTLRNLAKVSVDDPGHADTHDDHTFTINASWNLHLFTLKYIGGYSQYVFDSGADADLTDRQFFQSAPAAAGGPTITVPGYYTTDSNQTKRWSSHELYLETPSDLPVRAVLGGYYYTERYLTYFSVRDPLADYFATPVTSTTPDPSTGLFPLAAPNPTRAFYSQRTALRSDNEAVYGQVEWDVLPEIRLTGAIRGNFDQRYGHNDQREIFDVYGIFGQYGAPHVALDLGQPLNSANSKATFSDPSGKVTAEYHPDGSLIAYATFARGYKSGGFDLGNFNPIPIVKPELLNDYEGGVKKTFGKLLLIDVSAYYYDYKNLQVPLTINTPTITPVLNPTTGVQTGTTTSLIPVAALVNAQKSRSYGVELEAVYSPLENLHFTLIYDYQNSKFQHFTAPQAGATIQDIAGIAYPNLDGNTIPQSPKNKVSFIPQYVAHLPTGDLSISSIFTYTDPQYYAVFNTARYLAPYSYNLDFRIVYQPKKSHFTAILYARNVTNSDQFIYYAPNATFPSESDYSLADQRSVGGELQYRF